MSNKTKNDFAKKLNDLFKESTNKLEKYVISDIYNSDEPEGYLKDILNHGCQSGVVSQLIYYKDTKDFFVKFIDEIDEIKDELEESFGQPLEIKQPLYNWLAWLGYEETARKIADKLGLELEF